MLNFRTKRCVLYKGGYGIPTPRTHLAITRQVLSITCNTVDEISLQYAPAGPGPLQISDPPAPPQKKITTGAGAIAMKAELSLQGKYSTNIGQA